MYKNGNIAVVLGFDVGALGLMKIHLQPDIQWVQCSCIVCQNAGSAEVIMRSGRIFSGFNVYAGPGRYTAVPVY